MDFENLFSPGSVGAYPSIAPDSTHAGLGLGSNTPEDFEGFLGDGDYIRLPSAFAGDIDYFNNAGVSQSGWPIAITDVSASHTTWLGFNMDDTDNLLYVCTRGATLTNFIFSSINSAGTIVNIATVTITQPNAAANWAWGRTGVGTSSAGACNFHRVADGSGNFRMLITSSAVLAFVEEIEFTVGGSLVQDTLHTVRLFSAFAAESAALHYKTPNGTLIGYFGSTSVEGEIVSGVSVDVGKGAAASSKYTRLILPYETGIFFRTESSSGPGGYPTLWKGRIIIVSYDDRSRGPVYFNQDVFNEWADALAVAGGVA